MKKQVMEILLEKLRKKEADCKNEAAQLLEKAEAYEDAICDIEMVIDKEFGNREYDEN